MEERIKLTKLKQEDLDALELQAGLMFSIKEIAIILGIFPDDLSDMIATIDSEEYKSFNKGRLLAEGKIRTSIYELAQNGSSPAQAQFLDLIENAKLDDAL